VQADIERLDDVEGEIEDPEGHLALVDTALLHLTPRWQSLGVLDDDPRLTERVRGPPDARPRGHRDLPRRANRAQR